MSLAKTTIALATGAILSAGVILACSDDSPMNADADMHCDCPAAEPPLDGRITRVEDRRNTGMAADATATAVCPGTSMLLGGGCFIDGQALSSVYLQLSGEVDPQEHQYRCYWQNPDLGMIDEVVAWATCLMPAE